MPIATLCCQKFRFDSNRLWIHLKSERVTVGFYLNPVPLSMRLGGEIEVYNVIQSSMKMEWEELRSSQTFLTVARFNSVTAVLAESSFFVGL